MHMIEIIIDGFNTKSWAGLTIDKIMDFFDRDMQIFVKSLGTQVTIMSISEKPILKLTNPHGD